MQNKQFHIQYSYKIAILFQHFCVRFFNIFLCAFVEIAFLVLFVRHICNNEYAKIKKQSFRERPEFNKKVDQKRLHEPQRNNHNSNLSIFRQKVLIEEHATKIVLSNYYDINRNNNKKALPSSV